MLIDILQSLSDTEIMIIAEELQNSEINEKNIYKQLIAKSNLGENLCDIYNELNSDSFRGTLPRLVAGELAKRLKDKHTFGSFSKSTAFTKGAK